MGGGGGNERCEGEGEGEGGDERNVNGEGGEECLCVNEWREIVYQSEEGIV